VTLLAGRRWLAWVCVALIAQATALRFHWSAQHVVWNQIYRLTITRWDTMALGALGALALRSGHWRPRASQSVPYLLWGGLIGFVGVAILAGGPEWARPEIQTYGASLASVAFLGMVLGAATRESYLLRRPLLVMLGKYSYFIYVVHLLIISHVYWIAAAVGKTHPGHEATIKLAFFVLASLVMFFLAALSWRWFESPVLRLKKRFEDPEPSVEVVRNVSR